MDASSSTPTFSRPKRRRRWLRRCCWTILLLLVAAGVLVWAIGEAVASRVVRKKLQTLVDQHLHARLEIGSLNYDYPYGVTVADVSLVTTGQPRITLASFRKLNLQLAEIPLGDGPLRIERIDIDRPTVHIVRTEKGTSGDRPLVRADRPKAGDATSRPKLSDVFRLKHVAIVDARVEYDDQRTPTPPLVWENLGIRVESQPASDGKSFNYDFAATGPLSTVAVKGTLDLDSLLLDIGSMQIDTRVSPGQSSSALPQAVQKLLDDLDIAGTSMLTLSGRLPLTNLRDSEVNATLKVTDAAATVPGWPWPVDDLDAEVSATFAGGKLAGRTGTIAIRSGSSALSIVPIDQFDVQFGTGRWSCAPVRAALAYVPSGSMNMPAVLQQPITLDIHAALKQGVDGKGIDAGLDGTTATFTGDRVLTLSGGALAYHDEILVVGRSAITGVGGRAEFDGRLNGGDDAGRASLDVSNVDLAKLMPVLVPSGERNHKGILNGQFNAAFTEGSLSKLVGDGKFRIDGGEFAKVPVLGEISKHLKLGQGLFIARNASGRFTLADRKATFHRIAISTSALRIRGTGDVGFDKRINFSVYADAAANWERDIKQTKIPILSDLGGAIAGGTQKVLGTVSKQFTHLRVTGTLDQPKAMPAPVPLLTENIARLFLTEE